MRNANQSVASFGKLVTPSALAGVSVSVRVSAPVAFGPPVKCAAFVPEYACVASTAHAPLACQLPSPASKSPSGDQILAAGWPLGSAADAGRRGAG